MDLIEEAHKKFITQLEKLPDVVKAKFRLCGGLLGLFRIGDLKADSVPLEAKRECVRQLVHDGHIDEHTIRMAFFCAMRLRSFPVEIAVLEYEEQMSRFEWSKEPAETLFILSPEA
jgi:hypothetical protein